MGKWNPEKGFCQVRGLEQVCLSLSIVSFSRFNKFNENKIKQKG